MSDAENPALDPVTVAPVPAEPAAHRRIALRVGKAALALFAAYYIFCLALLTIYRIASPLITGLQLQRRVESWRADTAYDPKRTYVPYSAIPTHVTRAVVAAEDGKFWQHHGFDIEEMRIAGMEVFDGEIPRGASTITQQLMKNLFGGTSRNPIRKLYDITLTPPAEVILGKQRIIELYLNNVEWGPGIFGIEAAARHHYGIGASSLSRSQAAGLAALLPGPLRRTPENTPQYRAEILRRMTHRGW